MIFAVNVANRRLPSVLAIAETYAAIHKKDPADCRRVAMDVFAQSLKTSQSHRPMKASLLVAIVRNALESRVSPIR